jgi:hypothetical protein
MSEVCYGVLRFSGVMNVLIAEAGGAFPAFCVMYAWRLIRPAATGVLPWIP